MRVRSRGPGGTQSAGGTWLCLRLFGFRFLESSWQRSVEVVFWVSVVFISREPKVQEVIGAVPKYCGSHNLLASGDFIGAFCLQNLTTDEDHAKQLRGET